MCPAMCTRWSAHSETGQGNNLQWALLHRIPQWAISPNTRSYILTSFPSGCHVVPCWLRLVEYLIIQVSYQHSNEHELPRMIAAHLSHHQRMCAITCLKVLSRINQAFALLLYSSLSGKHGSRSSSFSHGILFCDVLTGWSCSGDMRPGKFYSVKFLSDTLICQDASHKNNLHWTLYFCQLFLTLWFIHGNSWQWQYPW